MNTWWRLTRISAFFALVAVPLVAAVGDLSRANVFKHNARIPLTGPRRMDAPHRWTGKLQLPDGWWCSATLVHRDLILTAAHCLRDAVTHEFVKGEYRFYVGYENGQYEARARVSYMWWGTAEPVKRGESDWAILRLAEPLGDAYGWMGVSELSRDSTLQAHRPGGSGQLGMTAFSRYYKEGEVASVERDCHFRGIFASSGNLLHDCSQMSGSSGAALYSEERSASGDLVYKVVAVNAAGTYVNNLVSNYGTATEFKNESANIAVPAARFLPKLKAIIASQKSEFEAALSGGAPTQKKKGPADQAEPFIF